MPPPDVDSVVGAEGSFVAESKYERLHHLLDQTSLFSKFLSERMPSRYAAGKAGGAAAAAAAVASVSAGQKASQLAERTAALKELIPRDSGLELHPFQIVGIDWLISLYENGLNGILADGRQIHHTRCGQRTATRTLCALAHWCSLSQCLLHDFALCIRCFRCSEMGLGSALTRREGERP